MKETYAAGALRRLVKNEIKVLFRGASDSKLYLMIFPLKVLVSYGFLGIKNKTFKIQRVSNFTARTYKFDVVDRKAGTTQKDITVEQYFKSKYNLALQFPELPLLETSKKGVLYPMECCVMAKGQKYPFKLDEQQVCAHAFSTRRIIC